MTRARSIRPAPRAAQRDGPEQPGSGAEVLALKPRRVRLSRVKGFRMPAGSVKVDRSTPYGNPFTPEALWDAGFSGSLQEAQRECVSAFRAWLEGREHWALGMRPLPERPDLAPLRGRNPACWCALEDACHADVLLDLSNRPERGSCDGPQPASSEREG